LVSPGGFFIATLVFNHRMSLGRRKVGLADQSRWVFNRMADVYDARPAYPPALVKALWEVAGLAQARLRVERPLQAMTELSQPELSHVSAGPARVTDIGAGIGHLALPMAARGLDVTAIEPAIAMLARLRENALAAKLNITALHASAESLPLAPGSQDLVVISDALHFLDAQRTGREVARVLSPWGALALITCELGDTPYMRQVVALMEDAVPRRPRALDQTTVQVAAEATIQWSSECVIEDESPVDHPTLERILRSISFIGPAMNADRFARFREHVHALPGMPTWGRRFHLRTGFRAPSRRAQLRAERARRGDLPGRTMEKAHAVD
jgi:SAM-dependent methyltransferase